MIVDSKAKLAAASGGSAPPRQAMKTVLLATFLFGLLCMNVSGKISGVSVEKSLKEVDIIAHLRSTSDVQIIPCAPKVDPREHRRIAAATVVPAFKGCEAA